MEWMQDVIAELVAAAILKRIAEAKTIMIEDQDGGFLYLGHYTPKEPHTSEVISCTAPGKQWVRPDPSPLDAAGIYGWKHNPKWAVPWDGGGHHRGGQEFEP
jgi:hypothetical protein